MPSPLFQEVGKRRHREDGPQLASGSTLYVGDFQRAGTLYGAVVRSGHAHARILRIDTSMATKSKGVACVITGADVPNNLYGAPFKDQPVLCTEKVRYEGDPVVALCAESWEAAAEAARKVRVEYEDLPAVTNPEEALHPDSPLIHESHPTGNLILDWKARRGDLAAGFAAADLIVEERYHTHMQEHAAIETHVCIAEVDNSGKLIVYACTQQPFIIRAYLSQILKLPLSRVRVVFGKVGGGFGGKHKPLLDPLAALCAMRTGRPVKFRLTREEEFTVSSVRHPYIMDYKTGVTREGKITARQIRILIDGGPYVTGSATSKAALLAPGPYRIDHLSVDVLHVYTNNGLTGSTRGVGACQATYACESHMDVIAQRLGMGTLEFRQRNALQAGDPAHSGDPINSCGLAETMEAAAKAVGWNSIGGGRRSPCGMRRRGRGIASMIYSIGTSPPSNPTGVFARMNEDATLTLWLGCTDVGQGAHVILRQIAAEEIGIPLDRVHIVTGDTDTVPYDRGQVASRTTHIGGNAVHLAAQKVKTQLLGKAAEMIEVSEGDLCIEKGEVFVHGSPEHRLPLAEVTLALHRAGKLILAEGMYNPPDTYLEKSTGQGKPYDCYVFATHAAEVEVDEDTGEYRVLQLAAAHDVGRSLNPMNVEGQIEGGSLMGLGFGTMERIVLNNGIAQNPNLADYLIPTALDAPDQMTPLIVEAEEPTGPFGAKGVGEPSLNTTAPAILNAIFDAVGARIRDLPATPEAVWRAMAGCRSPRAKNSSRKQI